MLLMVSNNTLGLFLWFIIKRGFPGCLCVCPCLGLGLAEPWPLWDKVMEGEVTPPYFSLLDVDAPQCWYLLVPEQVAECSGILEWLTQFGWVGAVTRFRLSLTLLVLVDWAGYWLHVQMGPQIWGMSAHVRILFIVASAVWQPLVQRW